MSASRVGELKQAVEDQKALVRKLQLEQSALNDGGVRHGFWRRKAELRKQVQQAINKLGELKADLTKLCGSVSDPRIDVLARAHRYISELEDRGVDLGEDGERLLDDIEFIVSPDRLTRAAGERP